MPNINDSYFDGYYKEIWKTTIPEELTMKEIDFMIPYFNLKEGSKVFDLMCGYGRHSIALAEKGIEVTALDNLASYITEVKEKAEKEKLPIKTICTDVISYQPTTDYDLAICMGNSFNFFNEEEAIKLLTSISAALKKGAHLLINSWSIAEIAIKNHQPKSWNSVGDVKFLVDSKFLFHPTRIEAESIMIGLDGKTEIKKGIDYIYSINEMEKMMNNAGLLVKEVYSIPGKKKFMLGDLRAYFVAAKQ